MAWKYVGLACSALLTALLLPATAQAAVMCGGFTATIVGTPGPDVINGTSNGDVIAGLGGNDTINGKGQVDWICGQRGADRIFGGVHSDRLYGGEGNDRLFEGPGAAFDGYLDGGPGADLLSGGEDVDWAQYFAAPGGVTVDLSTGTASGAYGADTLVGIEIVQGSAFNDTIFSEPGAINQLYGEGGEDYLNTVDGQPDDGISGGDGTDTCDADSGDLLSSCP